MGTVAANLASTALLCIDVSGSMSGRPLEEAILGGVQFLDEAAQAGYRCGLVLWHHGVARHVPVTAEPEEVGRQLRAAISSGGNDLCPTLRVVITELGERPGDRVVCVFGDGDVGPEAPVAELAAQARALGIRFVVRGLGSGAAECLSRTLLPDSASEPDAGPLRTVHDVAGLRAGIASMASSLRGPR
ncbi:VWA domain-containing protein [Pseudonocardia sp. ICBG1034]|uniref:vWA domain-containing protein n=1 Tax=Pseudonocardia sp. ICBG1034 TaxID=2844381 RepID=UPI001CCE9AA8|nr:vWA domain-containing protein [Pseudonocardia sp. ICBG1034]